VVLVVDDDEPVLPAHRACQKSQRYASPRTLAILKCKPAEQPDGQPYLAARSVRTSAFSIFHWNGLVSTGRFEFLAFSTSEPVISNALVPGRSWSKQVQSSTPLRRGITTSVMSRSMVPLYSRESSSASCPSQAARTLYPLSPHHSNKKGTNPLVVVNNKNHRGGRHFRCTPSSHEV